MKKYIGTKQIEAEPMTKGEAWNQKLIREKPLLDEDLEDGYKVRYEDGYESWSPKDIFEKAYYENTGSGIPFGIAIEQVKRGKGMRMTYWKKDEIIRLANPAKLSESSPTKESVAYCMCTDVALVIGRETTEEENNAIRNAVRSRIHEQMFFPFLYIGSVNGSSIWTPIIEELLSNDWEIVE